METNGRWRTPPQNPLLEKERDRRKNRARLLIVCPDGPGIIAAVTRFLHAEGGNIVQSDQYSSNPEQGLFFMRIEFEVADLAIRFDHLQRGFTPVAQQFRMEWHLRPASVPKRVAIFVSKEPHCLMELLWQWQAGDLFADIVGVVSNHPDAAAIVEPYGIPFHIQRVTKETKGEAEIEQLQVLDEWGADMAVLARYMQILSPQFVDRYRQKIINIHHSFLPAFIGNNPYQRAYQRGVKLIGATAHYVTADLDEGPIIEQDVHRVDHRDEVDDMKRIGRHVERVVIARAVKWHLEDRILVYGNKTVVFA